MTETLARPELEQGSLVRVLDVAGRRSLPIGWFARAPPPNNQDIAFRDWLLAEGRASSEPSSQAGNERCLRLL